MKALLLLLAITQNYLLMQPIQNSLHSGNAASLASVCQNRLAVHLEAPLALQGYWSRSAFADRLSALLAEYQAEDLSWSSIRVEETLAVQSLNLSLKNRFTSKKVVYTFVFFMNRNGASEWKIFYLRGLQS